MLRLLGFALLVLLVWNILGLLPFLGNNFLGLWVAVILTSMALSWYGKHALVARRTLAERRALEAVDTPNNRGKLGALLLHNGQARAALPHLVAAVAGEPESCEWGFRLGCARLRLGQPREAISALEPVLARDDGYAYGAAQLRLADALREAGEAERALQALDGFDRNHGESPESVYRRGQVLLALGRKAEARASFASVSELASQAARYQKGSAASWALRARLARLF